MDTNIRCKKMDRAISEKASKKIIYKYDIIELFLSLLQIDTFSMRIEYEKKERY